MAVSRRLRFEILRRDGYTCRYCGAKAPDVKLAVDHVVPQALGGTDDPTNLVTACSDCNAGKSSTSPDDVIVADVTDAARIFADAIEIAVQRRRERLHATAAEVQHFRHVWDRWTYTDDDTPVPLPTSWEQTIERFLSLGLTLDDLEGFVENAMTARLRGRGEHSEFRYFCGIAWRVVEEITEEAAQIVTETGEGAR